MNRRVVAVAVTSLSLLATGFMTTAPAANAGSLCVIDSVTPARVSVGLSATAVTVKPKVTGCTLADWYIYGEHLDVYAADSRQVFDATRLANADAGSEGPALAPSTVATT